MAEGISSQPSGVLGGPTKVFIRLMFIRIGEIDTLNEKYQAQASIEARWPVDFDKFVTELSADDRQRLNDGKSVSLPKYADTHWHPQLYIENALGDLKEQIRYTIKKSNHDYQTYICEHRDIKGLFWEKLELQHFPSDVQDLSISVASLLYDDKVNLVSDPYLLSGVNRESFIDQQEWLLYKHVDSEQRFVKDFLLRGADEEDEKIHGVSKEAQKRPVLTVTCHAARQSNYFYWNGYCLIFSITLVSFCVFGLPPNVTSSRVQIDTLLLLTSITFRWTVNRSLPTISYLTSMDIYSIICIFTLILQSIWHAIIGSLIFLNTPDNRVNPDMWFVKLDQIVLISLVALFILLHIGLISWLYAVPFKHRSNMEKKDEEYTLAAEKRNNRPAGKGGFDNSAFSRMPIDK